MLRQAGWPDILDLFVNSSLYLEYWVTYISKTVQIRELMVHHMYMYIIIWYNSMCLTRSGRYAITSFLMKQFLVLFSCHVTRSLRFASGASPANLLAASMAAEPFSSMYLRAGIGGARDWDLLYCCLTVWNKTDALLTELCQLGTWFKYGWFFLYNLESIAMKWSNDKHLDGYNSYVSAKRK